MQQSNNTWFTHFHMHDLRKRIALDIVNQPRNIINHSKITSQVETRGATDEDGIELNRKQLPYLETEQSGENQDHSSVPNWSNGPTGRKCRSHRIRRAHASLFGTQPTTCAVVMHHAHNG